MHCATTRGHQRDRICRSRPVSDRFYLGAFELTIALSIDKKVSRAASSIGDILALTGQVDEELLQTKLAIAESIMSPLRQPA